MAGIDVLTTATIVEAAASVLALVIATAAIIIPAVQQHRRATAAQKERLLEAKCLATAIRFELHELLVALSGLDLKAASRLAALSAAGGIARPSGGVTQEFLAAKIDTPPILVASGERVYILGDPAGPTVLRLLAVLKTYNEAIDKRVNLTFTKPDIPEDQHWLVLRGFVKEVTPVVQQALKEVGEVAAR